MISAKEKTKPAWNSGRRSWFSCLSLRQGSTWKWTGSWRRNIPSTTVLAVGSWDQTAPTSTCTLSTHLPTTSSTTTTQLCKGMSLAKGRLATSNIPSRQVRSLSHFSFLLFFHSRHLSLLNQENVTACLNLPRIKAPSVF